MADAAARRIADRYATALYDVAAAGHALGAVAADVAFLTQCLATSPELARVLKDATVADPDKLRVLLALMDRQVDRHAYTRNFLKTLVAGQRVMLLPDMLDAFQHLAETRAGRVAVTVTTAVPLDAAQSAALDAALVRKLGRPVRVTPRVRPDLLDGLTVQVGCVFYDASLRGKLCRLERELKMVAF